MKKIYVIVSDSGSVVAKALKFFTKEKYVHVTISFDEELKNAYSFGRKYTYIPLPGGLINENYSKRCRHFSNIIAKIYELDITDYQYRKLKKDFNNNYLKNIKKYKYNVKGLYYIKKNKAIHREYHFVCSQFCGKLLSDNNIISFDKDYSLLKPEDFFDKDYSRTIFEGKLLDYLSKKSSLI